MKWNLDNKKSKMSPIFGPWPSSGGGGGGGEGSGGGGGAGLNRTLYTYKSFLKAAHETNPYTNIKQDKNRTHIFEE